MPVNPTVKPTMTEASAIAQSMCNQFLPNIQWPAAAVNRKRTRRQRPSGNGCSSPSRRIVRPRASARSEPRLESGVGSGEPDLLGRLDLDDLAVVHDDHDVPEGDLIEQPAHVQQQCLSGFGRARNSRAARASRWSIERCAAAGPSGSGRGVAKRRFGAHDRPTIGVFGDDGGAARAVRPCRAAVRWEKYRVRLGTARAAPRIVLDRRPVVPGRGSRPGSGGAFTRPPALRRPCSRPTCCPGRGPPLPRTPSRCEGRGGR